MLDIITSFYYFIIILQIGLGGGVELPTVLDGAYHIYIWLSSYHEAPRDYGHIAPVIDSTVYNFVPKSKPSTERPRERLSGVILPRTFGEMAFIAKMQKRQYLWAPPRFYVGTIPTTPENFILLKNKLESLLQESNAGILLYILRDFNCVHLTTGLLKEFGLLVAQKKPHWMAQCMPIPAMKYLFENCLKDVSEYGIGTGFSDSFVKIRTIQRKEEIK